MRTGPATHEANLEGHIGMLRVHFSVVVAQQVVVKTSQRGLAGLATDCLGVVCGRWELENCHAVLLFVLNSNSLFFI